MANQERCLRQKIGSCGGCPMVEMVLSERNKPITQTQEIIVMQRISGEFCPTGEVMQVPTRKEAPLM